MSFGNEWFWLHHQVSPAIFEYTDLYGQSLQVNGTKVKKKTEVFLRWTAPLKISYPDPQLCFGLWYGRKRGSTDKSSNERWVSGGEEVQQARCWLARLTLITRKQSCSSTVKKQIKKMKLPPCENSRSRIPFSTRFTWATWRQGVGTRTVIYYPGGSPWL